MTAAQKVARYHRTDTTPMTAAQKVFENRLRRQLQRMGYYLMKSRARDPYDITFGGYQIVNVETNGLSGGHGNAGRGYGFTLDDVQDWIKSMTTGSR